MMKLQPESVLEATKVLTLFPVVNSRYDKCVTFLMYRLLKFHNYPKSCFARRQPTEEKFNWFQFTIKLLKIIECEESENFVEHARFILKHKPICDNKQPLPYWEALLSRHRP